MRPAAGNHRQAGTKRSSPPFRRLLPRSHALAPQVKSGGARPRREVNWPGRAPPSVTGPIAPGLGTAPGLHAAAGHATRAAPRGTHPGNPRQGGTPQNLPGHPRACLISIVGSAVTPYGSSKPVLPIEQVEGEPLPHRVAGNSQETWLANVLPAMRRYDAGLRDRWIKPWSSWPSNIYFSVRTGNGKYVHAKGACFDSRALVVDAFPVGCWMPRRGRQAP